MKKPSFEQLLDDDSELFVGAMEKDPSSGDEVSQGYLSTHRATNNAYDCYCDTAFEQYFVCMTFDPQVSHTKSLYCDTSGAYTTNVRVRSRIGGGGNEQRTVKVDLKMHHLLQH